VPLSKLQFKPGINRENTNYAGEGGWFDGDKVRFRSGYPEKIGGWENLAAGISGYFINYSLLPNALLAAAVNVSPQKEQFKDTLISGRPLGDITGELSHYETAWEISKHRYARAKRTLGRRAFEKNEYEKAIEFNENSLDIALALFKENHPSVVTSSSLQPILPLSQRSLPFAPPVYVASSAPVPSSYTTPFAVPSASSLQPGRVAHVPSPRGTSAPPSGLAPAIFSSTLIL
jgi:hypothetical protein